MSVKCSRAGHVDTADTSRELYRAEASDRAHYYQLMHLLPLVVAVACCLEAFAVLQSKGGIWRMDDSVQSQHPNPMTQCICFAGTSCLNMFWLVRLNQLKVYRVFSNLAVPTTSSRFGLADLAGLLIYCSSSYAGAAGTLPSDSIKIDQ